jgi:SAM-dependent methyltransferase
LSTDEAWRQWGERDPYFAVLTDPRYRRGSLDDALRHEFFETGRHHAQYVLQQCRRVAGAGFAPARVLDFGCGVGRVTLALAEHVPLVVGLDIAPAMLAEAQLNAQQRGCANVEWVLSDDALSRVAAPFDLIHSCITFQHIDVPRGRILFARLVGLLGEGGVGALHVTYAKSRFMARFGQPPAQPEAASPPAADATRDPAMQMNAYHLGELAFVLQACGVREVSTVFTDHGGEWGAFLFFVKPARA